MYLEISRGSDEDGVYIHIQSFWVFKVGQNVSGEALQTESFGYFKKLRKLDKGDLCGELIMRW